MLMTLHYRFMHSFYKHEHKMLVFSNSLLPSTTDVTRFHDKINHILFFSIFASCSPDIYLVAYVYKGIYDTIFI